MRKTKRKWISDLNRINCSGPTQASQQNIDPLRRFVLGKFGYVDGAEHESPALGERALRTQRQRDADYDPRGGADMGAGLPRPSHIGVPEEQVYTSFGLGAPPLTAITVMT